MCGGLSVKIKDCRREISGSEKTGGGKTE